LEKIRSPTKGFNKRRGEKPGRRGKRNKVRRDKALTGNRETGKDTCKHKFKKGCERNVLSAFPRSCSSSKGQNKDAVQKKGKKEGHFWHVGKSGSGEDSSSKIKNMQKKG